MTSRNFTKYIVGLLSLCFVALFSCTYDYFEDENNFRIYVPQIKEGTIDNFYIAFHDEGGNHVLTREINAPFNKDELMMEGILRFKLRPGNYDITCFAEYAPASITQGEKYSESHKTKSACDIESKSTPYSTENSYYELRNTNPRFLSLPSTTAYPIGHPGGLETVEVDMNENQTFKGKVEMDFIGLPSIITHMDVTYKGLGVKMKFNGSFGRYSDNDCIFTACETETFRDGNVISITDHLVYPSAGCEFVNGTRSVPSSELPLELEIVLYDALGSRIGVVTFTNEDFMLLDDSQKPKDENGNTIQSLVLNPRHTIKFTFKGFTVISVDLEDWGDTTHGEVTPM